MFTTKLILTGLLALIISTTAFAEHKHQSQQRGVHHQVKFKAWGHKADRHYRSHRRSAKHYHHKHNYHRYQGRTVYRTVKHYRAHRDSHRYNRRYEHRLSYNEQRRDAYRLIAGTIVLNEVLHHLHH